MNTELFDSAPDRRGTGSYKWDSSGDKDMIPLWVADMDFKTAPNVIEALRKRVDHGVFGYTLVDDTYYKALIDWFGKCHKYSIKRDSVIYTSGVVPALSAIIKALAPAGSGIIVQTPVYNCFFSSIKNNGCRIENAPLIRKDFEDGTFTFYMDYDALEVKASMPDVKLMLLCNPHNPAGRAWTRDELERVSEICRRNDVLVISDEIHCELTLPGIEYVPYGTIDDSSVICLSPSKAFNIAGLQIANIICPDPATKNKIDRAININEVCDVNPFGPVALKASYSEEGEKWLDGLKCYINDNYLFLKTIVAELLPYCKISRLEATYLPVIDISCFGINSTELEERLKNEASVWLNSGDMYGEDGFLRINIACPRATLAKGIERMVKYLRDLSGHRC